MVAQPPEISAKLHKSLAAAMAGPPQEEGRIAIIIKVRHSAVARGETTALSKMAPSRTYRLLDAQAMTASPLEIKALTEDPGVEFIWPDLPVHAWLGVAVPIIQAPRVWDNGFTGRGVKVATIDTGLDGAHPDFADRLLAYRDFVEPDGEHAADPRDPNGHGTHVAGIAAGSGAASDGRYRGVAPEAGLIIGRALDAAGNGSSSRVMAAIEWAVDQGAQVINISLGGAPYPADGTDALSLLCNAAVEQGVIVCAAAGNLGPAGLTVGAPGAAAEVITIGAAEVHAGPTTVRVATFSSRGPTADGRVKPDLLFPGVGIVAPRATGTALGSPMSDRYAAVSGTSQATPMAAGTAALLLQANPRLTPDEMKSRMMRGAHLLPDIEAIAQGTGLGDSYNTFISAAGPPLDENGTPSPPPDEDEPPAPRPGCLAAVAARMWPGHRAPPTP